MYEVLTNPIEQEGQRVLTTAQLAEYYETTEKIISQNFNRNRDRFIEGKHYYCLTGEELKEFLAVVNLTNANCNPQFEECKNQGMQSANCGTQNINKVRMLYLWTERGALLHAKSLNTDKA